MPADKWICCLCDRLNVGNRECKEQSCPHSKRCENCTSTALNPLKLDGRTRWVSLIPDELSPVESPIETWSMDDISASEKAAGTTNKRSSTYPSPPHTPQKTSPVNGSPAPPPSTSVSKAYADDSNKSAGVEDGNGSTLKTTALEKSPKEPRSPGKRKSSNEAQNLLHQYWESMMLSYKGKAQ